jgi:uncharacterized membrane protein
MELIFFIDMYLVGRALGCRTAVEEFVGPYSEHKLRHLHLTSNEWTAIALVKGWLKVFREATTEMSTTKHCMLSSCVAMFRSLEDRMNMSRSTQLKR